MIRAAGLAATSVALWAALAAAGTRSEAVSRSILQPEDRTRMLGPSTFADDALKSLRSRSSFDPQATALIGRRSEYAVEAVGRLRAVYSPEEMRIIQRRSEMGEETVSRMASTSDPAVDPQTSLSSDEQAWSDRVVRSSTASPDAARMEAAVRDLLLYVERQSVSTRLQRPAGGPKDRRDAIRSLSAD